MRIFNLRKDNFYPLLYSLGLMVNCALAEGGYSADKSLEIKFKSKSYELSNRAQGIQEVTEHLKANPNVGVSIQGRTQNLKKSSLAYIIEQTRVLKIFQALVREGIDASRIELRPVESSKADVDAIGLEFTSSTSAKPNPIVASASSEAGEGEYTLNFPSASAVPENLDEGAFKNFLATVGQPNRDAIVIEGYTDSVGNAVYNSALGELRALSVFELMVRQGLPPYRVDTKSVSKASEPGKGKDSASDRKVVIRWTQNAAIAEVAAKVEEVPLATPPPPPAKTEATAPEVKEESSTAPVPPAEEKTTSFDLVAFAGALVPGGELKDHAKSGTTFGLGIGKAFWSNEDSELRATLFLSGKSNLKAKESTLSGPLDISSYSLRGDYVLGGSTFRPFIGAGVGVYAWKGTIVQNSSQLRHVGSKNDIGGILALGLDVVLMPDLFLAPELSYHGVAGEFSEKLFSGVISLRWRI